MPAFLEVIMAKQNADVAHEKVRVVEKYVCIKQCFDGRRVIEPKANVFYTERQIPKDLMSNFKKVKVTEVMDGK